MTQPNDVPPFRGDLSPEDTDEWLQTLVAATGSFSDAGIFRLLLTKFVKGSPARDWFNGLDGDTKTSWSLFEDHFHAQWITAPRVKAQEEAKWAKFCNHKLTYEMVLSDEDSFDPLLVSSVVPAWAQDHLQLGQGTNQDDQELIKMTTSLLPGFIQAYLQVYTEFEGVDFKTCCTIIEDIPTSVFWFEWLRRQKSSKEISPLEAQIREISRKVDHLLANCNHRDSSKNVAPLSHQQTCLTTDRISGASVTWEACSPLTSVMSADEASEITTPTAEQIFLPDIAEAINGGAVIDSDTSSQGNTSLPIPQQWRKPTMALSGKDRIAIMDQALDFAFMFGSVISYDGASVLNSAVAIFENLAHRKSTNRDTRNILPADRHPGELWYSIEMVHRYRADHHPLTLHLCREEWCKFVLPENIVWHRGFICPTRPQTLLGLLGNSASNCYPVPPAPIFGQQPTGDATMAGGFCMIRAWPKKFDVLSDKTVLFMTLSSYLAECTSDPRLLKVAIETATCIKNHMLDLRTMLIKDCCIDPLTSQERPGAVFSCHLTGIAIEGFSVLATISGDDTWGALALDIAEAAMNTREWHRKDGILNVGQDDSPFTNSDVKAFKGLLNRGLLMAYQRNPDNKPFRNLIRSYVNVQFNALLDLSSRENSYGVDWSGPYVGPYPHGQLAALDTLIAAIGVNEP